LKQQINDFDNFITAQRFIVSSVNPFSDATILNKYYSVFDSIAVESINLSNQETQIIKNLQLVISNYTRTDFVNIKTTLISYRDYYADTVGLTDATYNSTIGRSAVAAQLTATIVDANYLLTLQAGINSVDFILANLFAVDAVVDPFTVAKANANNPDVNIGSYSSGTLVKFSYGQDLEAVATQYLGDPNKWIDIAIANGLQPPYIDEVGTQLLLLANGDGNQINIAATDPNGNLNLQNFFINQVIFLQSNAQPFPDQRTITNIRQIPVSGEIVLQLDGDSNLDLYRVADSATVRYYTPNTINCHQMILIPSNSPLPNTRTEDVPWFLASSSNDLQLQKVDLAIDDNGEINFGSSGDFLLSYGLANATQAIKLKIITELGSLRYHPTYGLVSVIGNKNNDLDSIRTSIVENLNNQIQIDPRFDRIETLNVQGVTAGSGYGSPNAILIDMSVRLAGGSTVIPITFTVNY
jgi:hypothetical protein